MKQPCTDLVRTWFIRNHAKEVTASDVHRAIGQFTYQMVGQSCKELMLAGEISIVRTEKMNTGIVKKFYRQVT